MIRALAQIFDIAISKGVSGITKRWSMVPRSRLRTTAAPARMMASMVTLLMMPITLVNQPVVTFGLKATRMARFTGGFETGSDRSMNRLTSSVVILGG